MAIQDYEQQAEPDNKTESPAAAYPTDGSVALSQTVEVTPVDQSVVPLHAVTPFEDFKTELHSLIKGGDYEHKSLPELEEIKDDIESIRSSQSARYAELVRLEAALQREMTWTNGYIIDLNKAIQQKRQEA